MKDISIKDHLKTFGELVNFLEKHEKNPDEELPQWLNDLNLKERGHSPFTNLVFDIMQLGYSIDLRQIQAYKMAVRFLKIINDTLKYKNYESWKATVTRDR